MSKSFRQQGLIVGVLGTHAATWLTAPSLGEIIVLVELALTVAVVLTATYGPDKYSSRAFRLLPWTADTNHPYAGQASGTLASGTLTANATIASKTPKGQPRAPPSAQPTRAANPAFKMKER